MHKKTGSSRRFLVALVSVSLLSAGLLGSPQAGAVELRDGAPSQMTALAVVAPPNGTDVGFAPNVAAITQGGSLTIVGADLQTHNLSCVKRSKKSKRPLCLSAFVSAGQTAPVVGVEKLPAGAYPLVCQLHPKMTVNLTVL